MSSTPLSSQNALRASSPSVPEKRFRLKSSRLRLCAAGLLLRKRRVARGGERACERVGALGAASIGAEVDALERTQPDALKSLAHLAEALVAGG